MLMLELWKDNLGSDNGFVTGVNMALSSFNLKKIESTLQMICIYSC